jgi:hypothetical protein
MTVTTIDDSGTTSAPAVCGDGYVCVPEAPETWNGPVAVVIAPIDRDPDCGGDFPYHDNTAYDGLNAPPAVCGCECGPPFGLGCANAQVEYHGNDAGCGTADQSWFVVNDVCNSAVGGQSSDYWQIEPPDVDAGSCSPSGSATFPDVSWTSEVRTCLGRFGSEGCEEGSLCMRVPDLPFEHELCIWNEGDPECPEGPFEDRRTYYTNFEDTRGCQSCNCSDPVGTCAGTLRTFQSDSCTTLTNSFTADGDCHLGTGGAIGSAIWEEGNPDPDTECIPVNVSPTGTVDPVDPRVFCCYAL